ncbi:MAG: hypothetical protein ACPGUC_07685, partial [Gammaproteobacteria bacterium]
LRIDAWKLATLVVKTLDVGWISAAHPALSPSRRKRNRNRSSIRARVEHLFRIIKCRSHGHDGRPMAHSVASLDARFGFEAEDPKGGVMP